MDRLLSVFGLYDFVSLVFTGAALLAGVWWAAAGVPGEPGASTVIALMAASFVLGHAVQAVGTLWEGRYWKLRGGWPSDARIKPGSTRAYDAAFRSVISDALASRHGDAVRQLQSTDLFGMARADLRADGADGRAELMNALYGMSRGFATTALMLIGVFVVKWIDTGDAMPWGAAAGCALLAGALFLYRVERFGYFFADQVWRDVAALAGRRDAAASATSSV